MRPFVITAQLQQGVVLDSRMGVALDSLLASEIRRKKKEELGVSGRELDGGLSRDDNKVDITELPLMRCEDPQDQSKWHWMATTALPVNYAMNTISQSSLSINPIIQFQRPSKVEQAVPKLPKNVSERSGRWRGRRIPIISTPAAYLLWSGVGDVNVVLDILSNISSIGQRRRSGEGTVISWEAFSLHSTPHQAGHFHPEYAHSTNTYQSSKDIGRPCYPSCLSSLEDDKITINTIMETSGMRPPYWHHSTQERAILPTRGVQ